MDTRVSVLIAAAKVSMNEISGTLADEFDTDFIGSLAEATAYPYDRTEVIVCGLYFDESRMFDLLRYVQLHPKARSLPFICMSAVEHAALSATVTQGIEIACKALGGAGFIDLNRWYERYGVASARSRVQQLIKQVARPSPIQ